MTKSIYRLRNIASRPIELHGGEEVAIIPASATIEVDEVDEVHSALIARGLLTCHAFQAAPASGPKSKSKRSRGKPAPASRSPSAKPVRSKGTGAKAARASRTSPTKPSPKRDSAKTGPNRSRTSPVKPSRSKGDSA